MPPAVALRRSTDPARPLSRDPRYEEDRKELGGAKNLAASVSQKHADATTADLLAL